SRFLRKIGFSYMAVFIAGASNTGARVAIIVVVSRSSAIPAAIFPMILAVAGITATRSAFLAREIWAVCHWTGGVNISVCTGRPVISRKVRGVTNSQAALVITT